MSTYGTGSVTVTAASAAVTGAGTAWLVSGIKGGILSLDGFAVPIASINSDTSMTLAYPWPGLTQAAHQYSIAVENSDTQSAVWANRQLADIIHKMSLTGVTPDGAGALAARPVAPADVNGRGYIYAVIEAGQSTYFSQYRAGAWVNGAAFKGTDGAPGANGAYSLSDPAGFPFIGDDVPFKTGSAGKVAKFEDAGFSSPWNLYPDAGRFAGNAVAGSLTVSTFAANPSITLFNAATGVAGPKFTFDNSTNGGAGAALDANVNSLMAKMRAPNAANSAPRRYGVEFFTWDVTAGAGTSSPLVVSAVNHYLLLTHVAKPIVPVFSHYYWFLVLSGAAAVGVSYDRFIDGVRHGAAAAYNNASGWKHVATHHQEKLSGASYFGYVPAIMGLYATPGARLLIAAPTLTPGIPPKGQLTPVCPFYGAFS